MSNQKLQQLFDPISKPYFLVDNIHIFPCMCAKILWYLPIIQFRCLVLLYLIQFFLQIYIYIKLFNFRTWETCWAPHILPGNFENRMSALWCWKLDLVKRSDHAPPRPLRRLLCSFSTRFSTFSSNFFFFFSLQQKAFHFNNPIDFWNFPPPPRTLMTSCQKFIYIFLMFICICVVKVTNACTFYKGGLRREPPRNKVGGVS